MAPWFSAELCCAALSCILVRMFEPSVLALYSGLRTALSAVTYGDPSSCAGQLQPGPGRQVINCIAVSCGSVVQGLHSVALAVEAYCYAALKEQVGPCKFFVLWVVTAVFAALICTMLSCVLLWCISDLNFLPCPSGMAASPLMPTPSVSGHTGKPACTAAAVFISVTRLPPCAHVLCMLTFGWTM